MRPPRAGTESGSVTFWMLGLAVIVLALGGLSLDLWRVFLERRELAGVVDAAAIAGASAIDEAVFRSHGEVRVDSDQAFRTACTYLRAHSDPPASCAGIRVSPGGIEVSATRQVQLTLLNLLLPRVEREPLPVRASARVEPRSGS
ncbi:MAG: pilus assembly protein TadG-related protein [Nitriliruptorales bacterium]